MSAQLAPTILCVDDKADERHTLVRVLQGEGFQTREAASAGEALGLFDEKPGLVILDVNPAGEEGPHQGRTVKAHAANTSIPVLHGSAAARTADLQWQAAFDSLREAVCLLDAEGRVLRCNRALATLLDRPQDHLVGQSLGQVLGDVFALPGVHFLNPEDQPSQRWSTELALGQRWFEFCFDPAAAGDTGAVHTVCTITDITEQKHVRELLVHAQQMEAVGRLARGVAHEFGNLIMAVMGNVSFLLAQCPGSDPAQETLQAINRAADRAADLTRRLLGYAPLGPEWQPRLACGEIIKDIALLLRPLLTGHVQTVVRTPPDLWSVAGDPGQLREVLVNLCLNARDAMSSGGVLTLEADNVTITDALAASSPEARPGEFVHLRVADTGHGIPPQVLPRIFDLFFTTKDKGRGFGLGLYLVRGIVQLHSGWITCSSVLDCGTQFDIYLPRSG